MYGNFAGRDASRGLAKSSFDVEMIKTDGPDDLADLNEEELGTLKEWVEFFENNLEVGTVMLAILEDCLSPSTSTRSSAENALKTLKTNPTFPHTLLDIISNPSTSYQMQQLCCSILTSIDLSQDSAIFPKLIYCLDTFGKLVGMLANVLAAQSSPHLLPLLTTRLANNVNTHATLIVLLEVSSSDFSIQDAEAAQTLLPLLAKVFQETSDGVVVDIIHEFVTMSLDADVGIWWSREFMILFDAVLMECPEQMQERIIAVCSITGFDIYEKVLCLMSTKLVGNITCLEYVSSHARQHCVDLSKLAGALMPFLVLTDEADLESVDDAGNECRQAVSELVRELYSIYPDFHNVLIDAYAQHMASPDWRIHESMLYIFGSHITSDAIKQHAIHCTQHPNAYLRGRAVFYLSLHGVHVLVPFVSNITGLFGVAALRNLTTLTHHEICVGIEGIINIVSTSPSTEIIESCLLTLLILLKQHIHSVSNLVELFTYCWRCPDYILDGVLMDIFKVLLENAAFQSLIASRFSQFIDAQQHLGPVLKYATVLITQNPFTSLDPVLALVKSNKIPRNHEFITTYINMYPQSINVQSLLEIQTPEIVACLASHNLVPEHWMGECLALLQDNTFLLIKLVSPATIRLMKQMGSLEYFLNQWVAQHAGEESIKGLCMILRCEDVQRVSVQCVVDNHRGFTTRSKGLVYRSILFPIRAVQLLIADYLESDQESDQESHDDEWIDDEFNPRQYIKDCLIGYRHAFGCEGFSTFEQQVLKREFGWWI